MSLIIYINCNGTDPGLHVKFAHFIQQILLQINSTAVNIFIPV